jgi:alpha-tubulin suppressor-like RCC1 family protein
MGDNLPAVDVGTGRTASALTGGSYHSCAILDNGSVKCWGANWYGQLGLGDSSHRGVSGGEMGDNLPALDFGSGRTAVEMALGDSHSCAMLDNGATKCWGRNFAGQLGLGDTNSRGDAPNQMGDNLPAIDL